MKTRLMLIMALSAFIYTQAQDCFEKSKISKRVIDEWNAWEGNPDSVTILIPGPPEFSKEDSAAIAKAVDMWNGTESRPKFKKITSGDPQISLSCNDNLEDEEDAVGTTEPDPDWVSPESMDVTLDTDADGTTPLSVALHELGHCLGLDDTSNPEDVMYEEARGVETFSAYDLTEALDVRHWVEVNSGMWDGILPYCSILPGESSTVVFPMSALIPPGSYGQAQCMVWSHDPMLMVEGFYLDSLYQTLNVTVYADPAHCDGSFYLYTVIILPDRTEPITFLGRHYINDNPVQPVTFECPMDIFVQDGMVHVNWTEGCTYPFGDTLQSRLLVSCVTGSFGVENYPDGDYILDLEPGSYTFSLFVDDFQVNRAFSTADFVVTGTDKETEADKPYIYPNPFSAECHISAKDACEVSIFDLKGGLVYIANGLNLTWKPAESVMPGVYVVRTVSKNSSSAEKVVYQK
jgi:hypothetical protein